MSKVYLAKWPGNSEQRRTILKDLPVLAAPRLQTGGYLFM